jgi:pyridoxal biosynthesis lyase PdxS
MRPSVIDTILSPFVCGCRDLGEALGVSGRRDDTHKGEAGTGNIVEAVRHMRAVMEGIKQAVNTQPDLKNWRLLTACQWNWLKK